MSFLLDKYNDTSLKGQEMEEIIVSIIIPTYKGSDSIALSVSSALRQTISHKEIIVVDDNGTGTEEQKKTENKLSLFIGSGLIKYICHDVNRNGSSARNTGLSNSSGMFVAFLDDDDYLMPEKINKQVKLLEEKQCSMCVCSGCYVDKDGKGYLKKLHERNDFLYQYLMDKLYFNTSAILFRRDALIDVGGFNETFRRHQDWELVTRILSKYDACVLEDVEMVRYIEGRNNPINFKQQIENLEHFFLLCEPYMSKRLSEYQIQKVKTFRRREICQKMIESKNIRDAVKYGKSYSDGVEFIRAGIGMIPLVIRKYFIGNRKVAPSKEKLFKSIEREISAEFTKKGIDDDPYKLMD